MPVLDPSYYSSTFYKFWNSEHNVYRSVPCVSFALQRSMQFIEFLPQ